MSVYYWDISLASEIQVLVNDFMCIRAYVLGYRFDLDLELRHDLITSKNPESLKTLAKAIEPAHSVSHYNLKPRYTYHIYTTV